MLRKHWEMTKLHAHGPGQGTQLSVLQQHGQLFLHGPMCGSGQAPNMHVHRQAKAEHHGHGT